MIAWIIKVLTGGSLAGAAGPWLLLAGVIGTATVGGYAGYQVKAVLDAPVIAAKDTDIAQANTRTEQCKAVHEKGRADGAEKVITAMLASAKVAAGLMDELTKKAAARKQSLDQLLKDIANAPPSKICGGSAAELAFRRSVQPPPAAAAP